MIKNHLPVIFIVLSSFALFYAYWESPPTSYEQTSIVSLSIVIIVTCGLVLSKRDSR
jgi:hypothetical protein